MSWRRAKRKRPLARPKQEGGVSPEKLHAEIKSMVEAGILQIKDGKPLPDDHNEEISIRITPGIEIVFDDPDDPDRQWVMRVPEEIQ